MADGSFAVVVALEQGAWQVRRYHDPLTSVQHTARRVRDLRAEGPAFAVVCVEDDYFLIVRPAPNRVRLFISDATAVLDDDAYAEDALAELGVEEPELDDDDSGEDPWPDGDFDVLADLGLSEEVLGIIADDADAWASEQISRIAEELGFDEELQDALER